MKKELKSVDYIPKQGETVAVFDENENEYKIKSFVTRVNKSFLVCDEEYYSSLIAGEIVAECSLYRHCRNLEVMTVKEAENKLSLLTNSKIKIRN